jgi:hypothetical protein
MMKTMATSPLAGTATPALTGCPRRQGRWAGVALLALPLCIAKSRAVDRWERGRLACKNAHTSQTLLAPDTAGGTSGVAHRQAVDRWERGRLACMYSFCTSR